MHAINLFRYFWLPVGLVVVVAWTPCQACPFCSATSQTLSQEMDSADAVVLATLIKEPLLPEPGAGYGAIDPDTGKAEFEIIDVLKGEGAEKGDRIEVVFFGPPEKGKTFFITGIGTGPVDWTTPLPLSEKAEEYVRQLPLLPQKGAMRLKYFQDFLEDDDPLLRQDSYDEFARAPYDEVIALKDEMDHDQLVEWITSPECGPSRRRLYLTMLGVCGNEGDIPMLESMILSDFRDKQSAVEGLVQAGLALGGPISLPLVAEQIESEERRKKLGLDAMVACYLTLAGPEVLDNIDKRFLKDTGADYTHIYNTLMALRFHGEETDVIPKERLLESVRLLLNHPDFADQVIPDLARWEDWEILDRLVQMFKDADEKSFVRQPVVTYLVVASEQEGEVGERAAAAMDELREVDALAVERAENLMAFGFLQRARPAGDAKNYTRDGSPYDDEEEAEKDSESDAESTESDEIAAADIPDPASGQFADPATSAKPLALQDDEATETEDPSEQPDPNPEPAATKVAQADQPQTSPTVSEAVTTSAADLEPPSTALMLGVPLIAGVLLMGLFWLILRSGSS